VQYLNYWIATGLIVAAVIAGASIGGAMWIGTIALILIALGIVLADRVARAKRPEKASDRVMNTSERPTS
jgi:Flp pilus assembly protein TadB